MNIHLHRHMIICKRRLPVWHVASRTCGALRIAIDQ